MADTTGKLVTQTPNQSTDPAPNFEQFEDWSQWTDALAKWVLEQVRKGEMSAGRLSCVFDVVEFQAKQLLQIKYLHSSDAGPVEGISAEQFWRQENDGDPSPGVIRTMDKWATLKVREAEEKDTGEYEKLSTLICKIANQVNEMAAVDGTSPVSDLTRIPDAIHSLQASYMDAARARNGDAGPLLKRQEEKHKREIGELRKERDALILTCQKTEAALAECRNKTLDEAATVINNARIPERFRGTSMYTDAEKCADDTLSAMAATLLALKGERQEPVDTKEKK